MLAVAILNAARFWHGLPPDIVTRGRLAHFLIDANR
jgi:hypothetical protein